MKAALDLALFLGALTAMELVAWATHKYLMHGPLWVLHRSHHTPRQRLLEMNDLFAVFFAAPSILLIFIGVFVWPPALWLGLGMAAYGAIYVLFHDGLVHRRFPLPVPARWLKRQVQAHRLHHAVSEKGGAVSFGFLWAPPVRVLKQRLVDAGGARGSGGHGPQSAPGGRGQGQTGRQGHQASAAEQDQLLGL